MYRIGGRLRVQVVRLAGVVVGIPLFYARGSNFAQLTWQRTVSGG